MPCGQSDLVVDGAGAGAKHQVPATEDDLRLALGAIADHHDPRMGVQARVPRGWEHHVLDARQLQQPYTGRRAQGHSQGLGLDRHPAVAIDPAGAGAQPCQFRFDGRGLRHRRALRQEDDHATTSTTVHSPKSRATHPFRVKKAWSTRDRSSGETMACS